MNKMLQKSILFLGLIFISMQYGCSQNSTNIRNNQPQFTQQGAAPQNGLITAKQAVEVYKQNPDWAMAECQLLRNLNKSGQSVNGNYWLSKSISNYRMTRTQLELMNNWLTGNYCPDVF